MRILFLILCAFFSFSFWGQNRMTTPTPVELLFGHNRIHFSASVNKPIAGKWRYDLLGRLYPITKTREAKRRLLSTTRLCIGFMAVVVFPAACNTITSKGLFPILPFTDRTPILFGFCCLHLLWECSQLEIWALAQSPNLSLCWALERACTQEHSYFTNTI